MKLRHYLIMGAATLGVIIMLTIFWVVIARTLATFFGFNNGAGNSSHYLFWSGAGSDLAYLSFLAAGITVYRKHNCNQQWCPRIGKHEFVNPETGVKRMLCWKHHPEVHHKYLTTEHIREIQHKRHLYFGKNPGRG